LLYHTKFLFTLTMLSIKKYRPLIYFPQLVQELLLSMPSFLAWVRKLCVLA